MNERIVETKETLYGGNIVQSIINVIFGIAEVGLLSRLVMKLFGADAQVTFVDFIYSNTNFMVKPFENIIDNININNSNPAMILETSSVFAIFVIGFIGWIISYVFNTFVTKRRTKITEIT